MSEIQESWYVFDMNPEHVDPRLIFWLNLHGIKMSLNFLGRSPGVIANKIDDLPEYCRHYNYPLGVSSPLKIMALDTQPLGDLRQLVDEYDSIHGTPSRLISSVQISGIDLRSLGIDPDLREGTFSFSTPLLPQKTNLQSNTTYVLASIRPLAVYKGRQNRGVLQIKDFWFSGTANGSYALLYNGNLTGASWQNIDPNNSFAQYDVSATSFTGGQFVASGGISSNRGSDKNIVPSTRNPLQPLSDGSTTVNMSLIFRCVDPGYLNFGFNWEEVI